MLFYYILKKIPLIFASCIVNGYRQLSDYFTMKEKLVLLLVRGITMYSSVFIVRTNKGNLRACTCISDYYENEIRTKSVNKKRYKRKSWFTFTSYLLRRQKLDIRNRARVKLRNNNIMHFTKAKTRSGTCSICIKCHYSW